MVLAQQLPRSTNTITPSERVEGFTGSYEPCRRRRSRVSGTDMKTLVDAYVLVAAVTNDTDDSGAAVELRTNGR